MTNRPAGSGFLQENAKGVANGVATLDGTAKIPSAQIPTSVTVPLANGVMPTALAGPFVYAAAPSAAMLSQYDASTYSPTIGTTSGSATVTDATAIAGYQGRPIAAAGVPANTYVGTVTPGVGYLLSSSPISQANVTATATSAGVPSIIGGSLTPAIPLANSVAANQVVGFKKTDASGSLVTPTCSGSDHIDSATGSTSIPLRTVDQTVWLRSDGASVWTKVEGTVTLPGLASQLMSSRKLDTSRWVFRKPAVMASPPSVTSGTANAATTITGSVLVPAYAPGAFSYLGSPSPRGTTYPLYTGDNAGTYPQVTSAAPQSIEFYLDTVDPTGRFEISSKGNGNKVRVCVQSSTGRWEYATLAPTFTHPSDGNGYLDLVTLGAPGRYNIRIEVEPTVFFGVRVGPTDTVTAKRHSPKRYIVAGDSFTEPTIVDSGLSMLPDGYPTILAHMTGLDVWNAGSGGTGYLQTNGGRPKLRDRMRQDILAFNPDGIIFAMGINDYGNFTAAQIGAEALLCFQMALASNPKMDIVVLSPFFPGSVPPTGILAARDAIQTACLAVGGRFLDLLSTPLPDYLTPFSTTVSTQANVSATSVQVAAVPPYFAAVAGGGGVDGWFMEFGTGLTTAELRAVTNVTGSGPYTLTVAALNNQHNVSEVVTMRGAPYMTGSGHQASRTVTDGVLNSTTTFTSATANFNAAKDQGGTITATGIPAGTRILSVTNSTTVVMTNAATATASSVSTTIVGGSTGVGNADRYTGTDGTHPTVAGHEYIAHTIAWLWAQSIATLG